MKNRSGKKFFSWGNFNRMLLDKVERSKKIFYTEHKRPQRSIDFNVASQALKQNIKTAIVLQGPLMLENDFTLETVRIYKKNFKGSEIIVSTWATEDRSVIEKMQQENITVVLSEKPAYAGISNINYQIVSTINGIMKAKESGAQYVIKSRTDQRIYAVNVMNFFLNLQKTFPLKNNSIQKERLIIPNINTFLYRMYGVSDMTMFGNIDDMILYWNADHDTRVPSYDPTKKVTVDDFAHYRACEIYLCTEFMKKIGKEPKWTIEDSWKTFAAIFCVIDHSSIDIFWPKYTRHVEFRNLYYASSHTHQLLKFSDWLSFYNDSYQVPDEGILEYGEGHPF